MSHKLRIPKTLRQRRVLTHSFPIRVGKEGWNNWNRCHASPTSFLPCFWTVAFPSSRNERWIANTTTQIQTYTSKSPGLDALNAANQLISRGRSIRRENKYNLLPWTANLQSIPLNHSTAITAPKTVSLNLTRECEFPCPWVYQYSADSVPQASSTVCYPQGKGTCALSDVAGVQFPSFLTINHPRWGWWEVESNNICKVAGSPTCFNRWSSIKLNQCHQCGAHAFKHGTIRLALLVRCTTPDLPASPS